MAYPFSHEVGGMVQAPFGLDHVAGGEAVFAPAVLAEFVQIGRLARRAHDLVELLGAIAVPMRELRHVAAREGRLSPRDRVQPKRRIGDDPRAITAGDLAMHLGAVGLDPFALDTPYFNTFGGRADLALRLQRDTLGFQTAMVDSRVDVEFSQALVGELGPAVAPTLDHRRAVPVPDFLAKAVFVRRAHGQHDMGVGFGHAVLAHIPMHIEIGDHAPTHEFAPSEVAAQFDAPRLTHLARDGEFHFAGKLGVLADLERLDIVPEPFAVLPHSGRVLRQHHLGMDDAALGGKVVAAIRPLVPQPPSRPVAVRFHRARAGLAANDLDVEMIDRHRDRIIDTAERPSERRISAPSLEKFSGGTTASQAVPATLQHYAQRSTIIPSSTLLENVMRKPRDFDGELKALQDKARDLKSRKVQQLGELVIATGADSLSVDELAGGLSGRTETKDAGKREAWARRGAAFFQSRPRRAAPAA